MPESIDPTKPTAEAFEDVFDALELAFWDNGFDDCESESLPTEELDNEIRTNCKIRCKTSFDTSHGCPVMITHCMYDSERNSVITRREFLCIDWENEQYENYFINILDLFLGYFEYSEYSDQAFYVRTAATDFESAKVMAKAALAAVS